MPITTVMMIRVIVSLAVSRLVFFLLTWKHQAWQNMITKVLPFLSCYPSLIVQAFLCWTPSVSRKGSGRGKYSLRRAESRWGGRGWSYQTTDREIIQIVSVQSLTSVSGLMSRQSCIRISLKPNSLSTVRSRPSCRRGMKRENLKSKTLFGRNFPFGIFLTWWFSEKVYFCILNSGGDCGLQWETWRTRNG